MRRNIVCQVLVTNGEKLNNKTHALKRPITKRTDDVTSRIRSLR